MELKYLLAITLGSVALLATIGATVYLVHPMNTLASPMTKGVPSAVVNAFNAWSAKYNKMFGSPEEATYRLKIFEINYNKVKADAKKGLSYKTGLNQFSDMSLDEFKQRILMNINTQPKLIGTEKFVSSTKAAASVDWRQVGAVTPIKNQGQCGSCWSFSTTGVLEGTNFIFGSKKLQSYAEQQLVDCCGKDGYQCQGCEGAWPEWAVNYVSAKGITTEDQYPYTAVEGTCNESSVKSAFKVSNYQMIPAGDETSLIQAVNQQPVSICVDASTWFDYTSGVFTGCNTDPQLDHAVLLVGYDAQNYIVKNSWDTTWGEQGFIRLPRGSNPCGIANHALTTSI